MTAATIQEVSAYDFARFSHRLGILLDWIKRETGWVCKEEPMKLLIIFPSWIPGGADRTYVAPIIPAAVRRGWEVHTACSRRRDLQPLVAQLQEDGAIHHTCEVAEWHCIGLRYRWQQHLFCRRAHRLLSDLEPHKVLLVIPWVSYGLGVMRACRARHVPAARCVPVSPV